MENSWNLKKKLNNHGNYVHGVISLPDATSYDNTFGWLVGFVALRPKSTAMVIAGRSVHLTTLFPGQA